MNQEFQLAIVTLAWGLLCLKELTLLFLNSELPCSAGFYSWCIFLDPRVPNLDMVFFSSSSLWGQPLKIISSNQIYSLTISHISTPTAFTPPSPNTPSTCTASRKSSTLCLLVWVCDPLSLSRASCASMGLELLESGRLSRGCTAENSGVSLPGVYQ